MSAAGLPTGDAARVLAWRAQSACIATYAILITARLAHGRKMIGAFTALLICQLAGEVLVRVLALPFPGPVAGLGLMFLALLWRGRATETSVPEEIGAVADTLLKHLSLLFIPAAVGIVQYLDILRAYAGKIALTIVVSTTFAMAVTALTFRLVSRLHAFRHKGLPDEVEAALERDHRP